VSLILNALRRSIDRDSRSGGAPSRYDRVLETLGYSHRVGEPRLTLKTLVLYGTSALAVGFFGFFLVATVLSPSDRARRASVHPPETFRPAVPAPRVVPSLPVQPDPPKSAAMPVVEAPATASIAPTPDAALPEPVASKVAAPSPAPVLVVEPRVAPPRVAPSAVAVLPPSVVRSPSPARTTPPVIVGPQHEEPLPSTQLPPRVSASSPDHFGLALYHQRVGDFESALVQYRSLLEQNDGSAEVHNNLGLLYQDHGDTDEAIREFRKAIAIAPRHAKAHNNLAVAQLRLGHLEAAASELRVALDAEPHNVESIVNLALVHKAAGRLADARELLRRAVTLDPRNAGSHYNLAVVADEEGDRTVAIQHYRAFLRFGTIAHGDLAEQVRARLLALGTESSGH
jgi:Tfp pilus assembly protein PilF